MKNMNKGILTDADMKKTKYKILYASMFTGMIVYCLISIVPVIYIMLSGFKDVKEMYSIPASFFPKRIDLSKLVRVWNEMKFYKYYGNTFIMALGAVVADVTISGLAGYVLSALKPKGTRVMLTIIFLLMLLPGTMRTVPLYMEFKNMPVIGINLLESFWPIWIMAGANTFNIILFKNSFDSISHSLVEAAWIDGCNNIKIFFKIILPLSVPTILVVAMFTFNSQLGQFFWPYLLISNKEMTTIGVQLYKMKTSSYTMDYQMIALFFSVIPQIVVFAIFQKQIIGGVNVGGVKG